MSCNYAEGLSPYDNKGKLGLPEVLDNESDIETKSLKLAGWIKEARHVVVHTGAGISTAAGIPDFRGPNGVWTLEEKGLKPETNMSFESATPTITHMGITALAEAGYIKYVISQNIDGLHLRSGINRRFVSELHGNMFIGSCTYCDRQFVLKNSVPTVGQKEIGINCMWVKSRDRKCRGKLRDNVLDWEDNLPEKDLEMAIIHSSLADLSICLGTTLQILPAGNLPLKAKKNKGRVAIVNLQPTKHHKKADLVIHGYVDKVISTICHALNVDIPEYKPGLDPTLKLREAPSLSEISESRKIPEYYDWTITLAAIKKIKDALNKHESANCTNAGCAESSKGQKRKRPKEENDECLKQESSS